MLLLVFCILQSTNAIWYYTVGNFAMKIKCFPFCTLSSSLFRLSFCIFRAFLRSHTIESPLFLWWSNQALLRISIENAKKQFFKNALTLIENSRKWWNFCVTKIAFRNGIERFTATVTLFRNDEDSLELKNIRPFHRSLYMWKMYSSIRSP